MGAVLFYHLTHSPLDATVRSLLSRSYGRGWRVAVRGTDPARLASLDRALWLGPEDEFLPHGRAGGGHEADQPILLTDAPTLTDRRDALMSLDGAEVSPDEIAALERVWILFEGDNDTALSRARAQWRAVSDLGAGAQYWTEDGGRWTMKMERAARS